MKIFDVIKYEGDNSVLVWKFPGEDFNTLSQLIVHETQEAIFFKDGQALDLFRAGRYTLHSQNIPLVRKVVNLPFNGESPFHCEVFFINKVVSMDIKWKTESAMPIQDPVYKIILPICANGQFAVGVEDSRKFLLGMVGQIKRFDQETLMNYFRGILMTNIKDYIVKQFNIRNLSFLEIQGNLKAISDGIGAFLVHEFEKYGLRLINFNVIDITPVEKDSSYLALKKALEKKAEMQVLGYNYQQERTYDILGTAAANEGTPSEFIGAGLGMGMGINIGNTVGGFMGSAISNVQMNSEKEVEPEKPKEKEEESSQSFVSCPHCGEKVPKGKFCIACGKGMDNVCPQCGARRVAGAKFCVSCGMKLDNGI